MAFQITTALKKIYAMKSPIRVVQGGTYASKTYSIIPILIDRAIREKGLKITIVAETLGAVKDGALDIFKEIMKDTNRWNENSFINSPLQYTFASGSKIQFKAFDEAGKAHAAGKRDILFLNEANYIKWEIANQLMGRSDEVYIDFNPSRAFWVHDEVLPMKAAEFLLLTYLDNEALSPNKLEELLEKKEKGKHSEYWANWWRVYGLGEIGTLQGAIFQNWQEGEFDDSLPFVYGQDFGFKDPDTLIKVAIDKKKKIIYADEVMYRSGNSSERLIQEMNSLIKNKNTLIVADCADARGITNISIAGFNIKPAAKGADSVRNTIKRMQDYQIIVTPNSLNLKEELRAYTWHDKKSETPIDAMNHLIDPLRYAFDELIPAVAFYFG
jgi:phage terminase large subunit